VKKTPLRSTKPLPKKNARRLAKRRAEEFGEQANVCRGLPCCACGPSLYGPDLLALAFMSETPISDAHHAVTRGAGGKDADTVPLCPGPGGHHALLDSPGWSQKRLEQEVGISFATVAVRLAAYLVTINGEG
jgi:hypothetical protein